MKIMPVSVALVLDPVFGDLVIALAQQMPVWIVASPINDQTVCRVRTNLVDGRITTLRLRPGEAEGDLLARAAYAIDEHHGGVSEADAYDTLLVYGTTERLSKEVATELGFKSITTSANGFKAEKRGGPKLA